MPTDSLAARTYEQILDRLFTGRWAPGHVFNRRQLATELGVSVAPVLEAMLQLRADGLIETLPRKGTRVRVLKLEDLRGQLLVREALECQAARLYCGAPVERHEARLLRVAAALDATDVQAPDYAKDDIRFHHALVTLAGVPALTDAYERVMKLGLLYALRFLHPDQRSAPRSSHVDLVHALTTTDPDVAEAALRAHAQSGKEAIFNHSAAAPAEPASPAWLR
jgi:DNA-binding GntR family transcriptional regulator